MIVYIFFLSAFSNLAWIWSRASVRVHHLGPAGHAATAASGCCMCFIPIIIIIIIISFSNGFPVCIGTWNEKKKERCGQKLVGFTRNARSERAQDRSVMDWTVCRWMNLPGNSCERSMNAANWNGKPNSRTELT